MIRNNVTLLASVAALAGVAGCASTPPPTGELAAARASVQSATTNGAVTRAPDQLIAARDKLARAEEAAKNEKNDEARRLAIEADADAQLASAQARDAAARNALSTVSSGNADLVRHLDAPQNVGTPLPPASSITTTTTTGGVQ